MKHRRGIDLMVSVPPARHHEYQSTGSVYETIAQLRDSNDETMTIDPSHLSFLYQGMNRDVKERNYGLLPYRLALLHADRAVTGQ